MQNPRRPTGNGGRNGACGLSNTGRPIVLDRQNRGTRPLRLICTLFKRPLAISAYRISQFAPALSGLPPDPRAATLPRTADGKAGGSFAVQQGCGFHTPAVLAWSAVR